MVTTIGPVAAIAGVPSGVQAQGPWIGRRQLFVRFAGEAETATMYTAAALASEMKRLCARSSYHSISIAGRDALANAEFLAEALGAKAVELPVMLDVDGQRPEALGGLEGRVALVQVTCDLGGEGGATDRMLDTLGAAAKIGAAHALVLTPGDEVTDGQILRMIERARGASGGTIIVVHPPPGTEPHVLDRRWGTLLEQATRVHADVRLALRVPPPVGMR